MSKSPPLETPRLILRDYSSQDWQTVHSYGSDPEFSKYEAWGPNSESDTKNFINEAIDKAKKQPRYEFEMAVCLKSDNLQIGGCGLRLEGPTSKVANIGWAINPTHQNHGFATEAASSLLAYGFETLGVLVVYATCDTRNTASRKVMEKLGMYLAGRFPNRKAKDGPTDELRYEIYKENYI